VAGLYLSNWYRRWGQVKMPMLEPMLRIGL
jgi:hypothetical protein